MRALLMAGLALACAASVWSQAPPGPLPPKPGVTPQPPPPSQKPQIRVRVELVNAPVTVRDANGQMVMDLPRDAFRIYDNGVEQRIEDFDLGGGPLSVVLVLESSSRVEPLLPAVRRAGIVFTQTVLGQLGEAAVISFDETPTALLPFTHDYDRIERTIANLRPGLPGSRLHDALAQGVALLRDRPAERRRVIVVVSEAADTGSETKLGAVLREAQLANITIYSVGLSTTAAMLRADPNAPVSPSPTPPGVFGMPPRPGTVQTPTTEQQARGNIDLLAAIIWIVERMANAVGQNSLEMATTGTGGLHVPTFRDRSIENALDLIGGELHGQYVLTYRPTGTQPIGFHQIKVEVLRPGLRARSRPGYYLPPPPLE
jgi:VWFA-related protein